MRSIARRLTVALGGAAAIAAGLTAGSAAAGSCEASVPFRSGADGYDTFRIPAVVATRRDTLLAFAEGRRTGAGDTGDIDLTLKRSSDGGCTWGPLQVVADSGRNTSGNPAPVVDPATGRVVLLTTYNAGTVTEGQIMRGEVTLEESRRVFVQHSDDEGLTWSPPREITAEAKLASWRWYATGPGHAIALRHGERAGRLVVPANHSISPPEGSPDTGAEAKYYGGHVLYSDDGGASWRIGSIDDNPNGYVNVNETTIAELPSGRLYLNTREHNGSAPGNRADTYSGDGGETLERPFRPQVTLAGPVVQMSSLQLQDRGVRAPLLFSGPADPSSRAGMAIRVSRDEGITWRTAFPVSGAPAAYSDLVQLGGATVGLLYETGDLGPYETIAFRRIPVRALED
jgi:sialidase-1